MEWLVELAFPERQENTVCSTAFTSAYSQPAVGVCSSCTPLRYAYPQNLAVDEPVCNRAAAQLLAATINQAQHPGMPAHAIELSEPPRCRGRRRTSEPQPAPPLCMRQCRLPNPYLLSRRVFQDCRGHDRRRWVPVLRAPAPTRCGLPLGMPDLSRPENDRRGFSTVPSGSSKMPDLKLIEALFARGLRHRRRLRPGSPNTRARNSGRNARRYGRHLQNSALRHQGAARESGDWQNCLGHKISALPKCWCPASRVPRTRPWTT